VRQRSDDQKTCTHRAERVGFKGTIVWDTKKPNGMMRKQLDVSKLFSFGWRPKVTLQDGIQKEYDWFLLHEQKLL